MAYNSDILRALQLAMVDNGDGTFSLRSTVVGGGTISGNLTVTGNLAVNGNLTFGDAALDTVSINGSVTYATGAAITAASYQIQRDADSTNQLHFNVPTGATMEWSVNDVCRTSLSATSFGLSTGGDLRLFNTSDEVTNTEFLDFDWSASTARIRTTSAGTGVNRNLQLAVGGVSTVTMSITTPFLTHTNSSSGQSGSFVSFTGTGTLASGGINFFSLAHTNTSSSGTVNFLNLVPTVSGQSGTAGFNALLINTGTASASTGTKMLINAQSASVTVFSVNTAGTMVNTGGRVNKLIETAISYTVLLTDYVIGVTSRAASRIITLPSAVTAGAGATFIVKDQSGSTANTITVNATAGNIDGVASHTLSPVGIANASAGYYSNGTNWFII